MLLDRFLFLPNRKGNNQPSLFCRSGAAAARPSSLSKDTCRAVTSSPCPLNPVDVSSSSSSSSSTYWTKLSRSSSKPPPIPPMPPKRFIPPPVKSCAGLNCPDDCSLPAPILDEPQESCPLGVLLLAMAAAPAARRLRLAGVSERGGRPRKDVGVAMVDRDGMVTPSFLATVARTGLDWTGLDWTGLVCN